MGEGGTLGEESSRETSDLIRAVLQQSTDNLRLKKKIKIEKAHKTLPEGFVKNREVSIHAKKTLLAWLPTHFCLSGGKCLNLRCPATLLELRQEQ